MSFQRVSPVTAGRLPLTALEQVRALRKDDAGGRLLELHAQGCQLPALSHGPTEE
ncbi:hypothetical protein O3S80_07055 [Streptomyces sp. Lzd4kr]|nr:hypothetical protein [Streptomyces sp. Lzd4kr]